MCVLDEASAHALTAASNFTVTVFQLAIFKNFSFSLTKYVTPCMGNSAVPLVVTRRMNALSDVTLVTI